MPALCPYECDFFLKAPLCLLQLLRSSLMTQSHPCSCHLCLLPVRSSPTLTLHQWPLSMVSLVAQSCPTLCDSMNCNLTCSSDHGILQARILEWVATPFSKGIIPTQGWNSSLLRLLHWGACSLPLAPLVLKAVDSRRQGLACA